MLIAPWSMLLASGYSSETSDGYEKATTHRRQPGFEKWEKDAKRGELNIFVGKRFLVTIEGDDLADTTVAARVRGEDGLREDRGVEVGGRRPGAGRPTTETRPSADRRRRSGTCARR